MNSMQQIIQVVVLASSETNTSTIMCSSVSCTLPKAARCPKLLWLSLCQSSTVHTPINVDLSACIILAVAYRRPPNQNPRLGRVARVWCRQSCAHYVYLTTPLTAFILMHRLRGDEQHNHRSNRLLTVVHPSHQGLCHRVQPS